MFLIYGTAVPHCCVLWQISSVVVCFLGSGPVACLVCCFSGETQIWLGDLRVVLVGVWLFLSFCYDLPHYIRPSVSMYQRFWERFLKTAYSHVRTEPQSVAGHTRGKKSRALCTASCVPRKCGFQPVLSKGLCWFGRDAPEECAKDFAWIW